MFWYCEFRMPLDSGEEQCKMPCGREYNQSALKKEKMIKPQYRA